jgi:hypothetical protein
MEFFNVAQELANLIWFRFATDVLQIQRPGDVGMFEDVVAPADPIEPVSEALGQFAEVAETDVVRTGEELSEELAILHTFTSRVGIGAQARDESSSACEAVV